MESTTRTGGFLYRPVLLPCGPYAWFFGGGACPSAYIARLFDSDPEYADNLTTQKLVDFAEAHPDYDILLTMVDGSKVLRFDSSPQHRHQIPHLLADDYLHSYLTDRNYESGSMQRVKA
ncbi:hypothetical protein Mycch_2973 [Mycolicibacterium chubuense NBB4]|uniref:Uncharacterized protein n=2 Tax=Mycolicibacterium chubuense TaxID=1800 RepID=I4BKC0_MYCCN|nr:hypothetical protein Mycch_2973 [Mycolicibacterium chubuense NBB4]